MKSTQIILLVIGISGIIASIFGFIAGSEFTINLTGMISGLSLIYCYFELKKQQKNTATEC